MPYRNELKGINVKSFLIASWLTLKEEHPAATTLTLIGDVAVFATTNTVGNQRKVRMVVMSRAAAEA